MASRTSVSLYTTVIIAPFAWAGLLLFTRFIPPHSFGAFVLFFGILSIALICTLTPIAYAINGRLLATRLYHATMRHALRQAILLSLAIVLNLILRALHSWNIFMAIVILGAAVIIEILSLARK